MTGPSILFVCDANICRSVTAEFVFEEESVKHSALADIVVASRGVAALPEHSSCRAVAEHRQSDSWSERVREHTSTQLLPADIDAATMILTATTTTRSAVVAMHPQARRKVFTLREALWLAHDYRPTTGAKGDDAIAQFTAHLDRQRGLRAAPEVALRRWRTKAHPYDIPDGHLSGGRKHGAAIAQVEQTVLGLVALLAKDPTLPFLSTKEPRVR